MVRLQQLASLALAVCAIGCRSERVVTPGTELSFAAATNSCGPTDGPAVMIYLANDPVNTLEPAYPFVRLYLPQSHATLAGRVLTFGNKQSENGAWFMTAEASSEPAVEGTLTVTAIAADSSTDGVVSLTFPSGMRVQKAFHARWISSNMRCG